MAMRPGWQAPYVVMEQVGVRARQHETGDLNPKAAYVLWYQCDGVSACSRDPQAARLQCTRLLQWLLSSPEDQNSPDKFNASATAVASRSWQHGWVHKHNTDADSVSSVGGAAAAILCDGVGAVPASPQPGERPLSVTCADEIAELLIDWRGVCVCKWRKQGAQAQTHGSGQNIDCFQ